jgi:CRP/FNR family transcriptional regulator
MSREGLVQSFALPNGRVSHIRCGDCPIRDRAVCAYCDGDELDKLDSIKSYREFPAGREVMAVGECCPSVGTIVRGVIKLIKTLPDGRSQMVGLLFPGDFVGHPKRPCAEFDAVAAVDTTLCLFQRGPFEALLRDTPHLEQRLLDMTLNELDAARAWLLLLGRKTARERIATFLLMLARRANGGAPLTAPLTFDMPLSRGEMAEYLGLTIETVSRHMTRLRADGVIGFESARSATVADPRRLIEEAGD